jgi:hypothetical protein
MLAAALVAVSAAQTIAAETPADDLVEVRGIVLDESGQPAANAVVTAASEPFDPPSTKSDAQGRFTLQVDRKQSK